MLREGDARIWSRPRASVDDGWLVVVFSVPEAERGKRHELRSLLTRLGFGTAAPGRLGRARHGVRRDAGGARPAGLASYTELFRGDYLGSGPTATRVAEWWDLPAIAALYDEFLADHRGLTRLRDPDPARAFTAYVPMLTAWRRLPYLDPGIPLDLLPDDWPGEQAGRLFAALDARLRDPAAEHAHALSPGDRVTGPAGTVSSRCRVPNRHLTRSSPGERARFVHSHGETGTRIATR